MRMSDWHIFVQVAHSGSTLAASHHLRVSQSTASRRIDALEAELGLTLFERRPSGYSLTAAGEALLPRAEAVVDSIAAAHTAARQQARGLSGRIRLTTATSFGHTFVIAALREFRSAYPEIRIELLTSEERLDLLSGEADVALRIGPRPDVAGLVAKKVIHDAWSLYCSRDYADHFGVPEDGESLRAHQVIGFAQDAALYDAFPVLAWLDAMVPGSAVTLRQHDIPGLLAALRGGAGVGLMSDIVAEADGTLVRCFRPPEAPQSPVWLVTTEHLRREPRIRALLDFLSGYLASGCYRRGGMEARE